MERSKNGKDSDRSLKLLGDVASRTIPSGGREGSHTKRGVKQIHRERERDGEIKEEGEKGTTAAVAAAAFFDLLKPAMPRRHDCHLV